MLTHFCFPGGDIIFPSREFHMPVVHHFVLTNDKGRKVYGTCLTVYEEYVPPENTFWKSRERLHGATVGESGIEVSVNPQHTKLYIPKVLCILSIWPYVKAFREYLAQIYRLATSTNCMEAPIERYVMNICNEIPAPPPGAFEVHLHILDSVIRFWSPPARLPIAYVALPYEILFDCLDIESIMHLWYCLTMERKVLLVSTQHSILTVCAEILCSMLYPMKWSHLYVPMLPQFLCPMLDAPVPYLCGVTRDNWMFAQHHVSDETIVVDLDRNSVMFGQNTAPLPPAPGKKWTKLHNSLQETVGNLFWRARGMEEDYQLCLQGKLKEDVFQVLARDKGDPIWRGKLKTMDQAFDLQYTPDSTHLQDDVAVDDQEQTQWDRVQEAFLRFFVALLKDYRSFLHIPDTSKLGSLSVGSSDWIEWNQKHSFDQHKFIASQKGEYTAYLSELCSTQQFDDFITKRLYSPNQPDIIFFDQSIDAKLNRSRLKLRKTQTPFLQSAKAHKQLEKFVAVKPNTIGLSRDAPFLYKYWPETFDNSLFGRPRPIPSIITAEFDRQASLAKQLRTSFASGANVTAELLELYGSDYDTNPEGMSFTVFFYTYCAVIGLEWQEYQNKRKEDEFADTVSEPTNGIDSRDRLQIDHTEEVEDAEDADTGLFSERTYSLCDGTLCQNGKAIVDNAVIYVAANSPCPNLNYQAQAAIETLTSMAACMDPLKVQRNTSLLDTDEAYAEFEEIRDVAAAQLDLAFDALKIMGNRGLLSDPDVFKSMMEACGRCGDTKRALELIRIMKRDKLVTDNDVLVCFMASFAQYGYVEEGSPLAFDKSVISGRRVRDAYSNFLRKKVLAIKGGNSVISKLPPGLLAEEDMDNGSASEGGSEGGSERSSLSGNSEQFSAPSFLQLVAPSSQISSVTKKKKSRRRKKKTSRGVTDRIQKQLLLGESLLEFLYPEIRIDTHGDTCPMCSNVMSEEDVISGWQPCEFQDLTSQCPQCTHRFVPRFKVSTTSSTFTGSQGPGTPLYCEFLSPWVIRKELGHIIGDGNNVEQLLDPDWRSGRDVRATIWWNLIVMLKRYNLPFAFLLQGSFKNRLITPGPQDV
ncbi:DENN (AEX-3) domain containing protein [Nitzschia inconspicua]|uniref:DENN (AEX-3) domain containing protein n=1 Tax=Nitzschia inconspicua TaxID=303405 RepID=A0A9K3LFV0_9STRA|nr:DENN (AEX-3) domain containing protein [Nitzschia inconspicua]